MWGIGKKAEPYMEYLPYKPLVIKPVRKIPVKFLGLSTGQFVKVRIVR